MDFKVYYKGTELCELSTFEECLKYIMQAMEVYKNSGKDDFTIYRKLYPM